MEISTNTLEQMLTAAAELGAKKTIDMLGLDKKQISQASAYRVYGRKRVDNWVAEKRLTPAKQGERIFYDKAKLQELSTINQLVERYG